MSVRNMPSSSNIYNQSFGIWLSYMYMKIMSVQGIEENGCLPQISPTSANLLRQKALGLRSAKTAHCHLFAKMNFFSSISIQLLSLAVKIQCLVISLHSLAIFGIDMLTLKLCRNQWDFAVIPYPSINVIPDSLRP